MSTPDRLLLLRHGQTDWNRDRLWQGHTDIPLNETGRDQARKLGIRMRDEGLDALYCSDLQRAAETAHIVGKAVGLAPVASKAWREIALGELEGTANRGEAVTDTVKAGGPLAPGAEDFAAFQARLVAGFEELGARHAGQSVAVVGHGGAHRTLIAYLLELAPRNINRLSLRNNTSVNVIEFMEGRPRLVLLNCIRHLG